MPTCVHRFGLTQQDLLLVTHIPVMLIRMRMALRYTTNTLRIWAMPAPCPDQTIECSARRGSQGGQHRATDGGLVPPDQP